jgi:hypothetical protein
VAPVAEAVWRRIPPGHYNAAEHRPNSDAFTNSPAEVEGEVVGMSVVIERKALELARTHEDALASHTSFGLVRIDGLVLAELGLVVVEDYRAEEPAHGLITIPDAGRRRTMRTLAKSAQWLKVPQVG